MTEGERNWTLLVPVTPGSRVLDLSGDDGQTAGRLIEAEARVRSLRVAEGVAARVAEAGGEAAVARGLDHVEGPFDAIIGRLGDVLERADAATLECLAGRLAPGGCLYLGLDNPPWALAPGRWLRGRLLGAVGRPGRGAWCGGVVRRLGRAGFGDVRVFAALPDRGSTKFLVPLGEPDVERYFLEHLVSGASHKVKAARALAQVLVTLGLFKDLVPAYEVLAMRGGEG